MTVLAVVSQAASLALMWRIWHQRSTPAEDGDSHREGKERSSS